MGRWSVGVLLLLLRCAPAPSERWVPVRGLERCNAERLASSSARFGAEWKSCGERCRTRPAVPAGLSGFVAERGASAAQNVRDHLYLRTSLISAQERYEVLEEAGDDEPLLVLRLSKDCHVSHQKANAALLLEMFSDPREHWVAVYTPEDDSLRVRTAPILVVPPISGWFLTEEGFGLVDAQGVRRFNGSESETLATSEAWLLSPKSEGARIAWVDWGLTPATIVEPGRRVTHDGNVAAFAFDGDAYVSLEVYGPSSLLGQFERSVLTFGERRLDLSGRVASVISMTVDQRSIGLTTAGDGAEIPPSLLLVDRASLALETISPPAGRYWELTGAARGRWLSQELDAETPAEFRAWIEVVPGASSSAVAP